MQFSESVLGSMPFKLQLFVLAVNGVDPLVPDDVTSWELRIFDGACAVKTLVDQSPTGTNGKLYDTLQTGDGWDRPGGFNFSYTVASDLWRREAGKAYTFEFRFNTANTLSGPIICDGVVNIVALARGAR